MSYPVGKVFVRDGVVEVIARCPFCGDTDNPQNGHLSVNITKGVFYCYRCGTGGPIIMLPLDVIDAIRPHILDWGSPEENDIYHEELSTREDKVIVYKPGTCTGRETKAEVFYARWRGHCWDVFEIKNLYGKVVGLHLREKEKKLFETIGDRLFVLPEGEDSVVSMVLKYGALYVVEGPYDILGPEFIAVLGQANNQTIELLRHFPVVLVPDGDVWHRNDLLKAYRRIWRKHPYVSSVVYIPEGKDPDEVGYYKVMHDFPRLTWEEFERWVP